MQSFRQYSVLNIISFLLTVLNPNVNINHIDQILYKVYISDCPEYAAEEKDPPLP